MCMYINVPLHRRRNRGGYSPPSPDISAEMNTTAVFTIALLRSGAAQSISRIVTCMEVSAPQSKFAS